MPNYEQDPISKAEIPTAAAEMWWWRSELLARVQRWYPTDVFVPVGRGEHYQTQDGAAAAMARHMLELIADELGGRSIELDLLVEEAERAATEAQASMAIREVDASLENL